jgi:hypothetical protein
MFALRGKAVPDPCEQVGPVDTGQGECTRHGADLSLEDPEQQVRRPQILWPG